MGDSSAIAAIATPPGRGGVGVVRISGVGLAGLAKALLGQVPAPRRAKLVDFRAADGAAIDRGLALFFPAPHSYTGQDVLELHGHGGPVVMGLLLERCLELGARLAEPGEFTRRAFENDKLDLAQAEGVADLIEAASAQAARAALRSLDGEFSRQVHELIDELIALRALVEATLDFPEEEVDFLRREHAFLRVADLGACIDAILARSRQGARLRSGLSVVLAGAPNVGKSSLMNALAGEEVAIVTALPGTTRDRLERPILIEGMPVNVIDTAGLRASEDTVERIGISRAREAMARADLVLVVVTADAPEVPAEVEANLPAGVPRLKVVNKIDLTGQAPAAGRGWVQVSAVEGSGLDLLRAALKDAAGLSGVAEDAILARARHIEALQAAKAAVAASREHLEPGAFALELAAEELRRAQQALAAITGEFTADDLLGEIFGRFCIGK
ncbi:MAG: tRNA uridine-5-carboxymethylaminomethyl(34) synthesis GTPase MnmE [Burkholderiales bacterium]|nr:tRNA uridine-5-carboxymethylaminomethyl(34) synthesis GTPase MnmE [Burkholderiales bacterium]